MAPEMIAAIVSKFGDEHFDMQEGALTGLVELATYGKSVYLAMICKS